MQDRTINSALLCLRKRIVQGDGVGLEHVQALLRQRSVPMPIVHRPRMKAVRSGVLAHMILSALRDGPQTARYVSAHVAERRPELTYEKAHTFAARGLTNLKKRGLVAHDGKIGGLWSVVQDFGPDGCCGGWPRKAMLNLRAQICLIWCQVVFLATYGAVVELLWLFARLLDSEARLPAEIDARLNFA